VSVPEVDAALREAARSARDVRARLVASRAELASVWAHLLALDNPATARAARDLVARYEGVVGEVTAAAEAAEVEYRAVVG
jgi:hypothetical protein